MTLHSESAIKMIECETRINGSFSVERDKEHEFQERVKRDEDIG